MLPSPKPFEHKSIHAVILARAELQPDVVALEEASEGGQQCDYGQLAMRMQALSAHLLHLSGACALARGRPVAILCPPGLAAVVAMLAALCTEAHPFLPLDPGFADGTLKGMIDALGVTHIITTERLQGRAQSLARVPVVLAATGEAVGPPDAATGPAGPPPTRDDPGPACVMFTSGSTGRPRGVCLGHGALLNRFRWMWSNYPLAAGEPVLQKTPVGFADMLWETFGTLGGGGTVVVASKAARRDVHRLLDVVERWQVRRVVFIPGVLSLLLQARSARRQLASLTLVTSSGEPLGWGLAARFYATCPQARLLNCYGTTEVAADASCLEVPPPLDAHAQDDFGLVPLGKAIPGMRLGLVAPEVLDRVAEGGGGLNEVCKSVCDSV